MANAILAECTNREIRVALANERRFKDRQNPLEDLLPADVFKRFRFSTEAIYYLTRKLAPKLSRICNRSNPLPVLLQVLVTLRFLSGNGLMTNIGDTAGICVSSVSKVISATVQLIAELHVTEIVFPDTKALTMVKKCFKDICRLPNVIGVIDGSLVPIMKPTLNTHEYICRKNFAAINIQVTTIFHFVTII